MGEHTTGGGVRGTPPHLRGSHGPDGFSGRKNVATPEEPSTSRIADLSLLPTYEDPRDQLEVRFALVKKRSKLYSGPSSATERDFLGTSGKEASFDRTIERLDAINGIQEVRVIRTINDKDEPRDVTFWTEVEAIPENDPTTWTLQKYFFSVHIYIDREMLLNLFLNFNKNKSISNIIIIQL